MITTYQGAMQEQLDNVADDSIDLLLTDPPYNISDKGAKPEWVDKETGMISPVNPAKKKYVSLYSNNTTQFAKVQIPHASKLLFQELMSLGIVPRIFTSSKV